MNIFSRQTNGLPLQGVLKLAGGIIITPDFLNTYQLNGMNRHDLYSRHVGIEYNYIHSTSIMGE